LRFPETLTLTYYEQLRAGVDMDEAKTPDADESPENVQGGDSANDFLADDEVDPYVDTDL